jgi:hypothetical protein
MIGVIIDRIWIVIQIYWPQSSVSPVFTRDGFHWEGCPFLWVPEMSPCFSHSSQLTKLLLLSTADSLQTEPLYAIQDGAFHKSNWSQHISKIRVILQPPVSRPVRFVFRHPAGKRDEIFFCSFLSSDSCRIVQVGRPLWRHDGSTVLTCTCKSQSQRFLTTESQSARLSWCQATIWGP